MVIDPTVDYKKMYESAERDLDKAEQRISELLEELEAEKRSNSNERIHNNTQL